MRIRTHTAHQVMGSRPHRYQIPSQLKSIFLQKRRYAWETSLQVFLHMTHVEIDLARHVLARNRACHYITRRKLRQLVIPRHETLACCVAQMRPLTA